MMDIEKETRENTDYRRVVWTTKDKHMQLVLMSIPVGQDIELEIHKDVDQFFRIEQGQGELHIGKHEGKRMVIKDGDAFIVERNTYHRVVNTGDKPLKLYTIYSPANHPPDRVQKFKPETARNKRRILYSMLF